MVDGGKNRIIVLTKSHRSRTDTGPSSVTRLNTPEVELGCSSVAEPVVAQTLAAERAVHTTIHMSI